MDPRDKADALLSRARGRGEFVVTPDNAVSPMDASSTLQIPRSMVDDVDGRTIDPDATTVLSDDEIRRHDTRSHYLADRESTSQLRGASGTVSPGAPTAHPTTPAARQPESSQPGHDVETQELEGLIPTTTQRGRSRLSQRLDG